MDNETTMMRQQMDDTRAGLTDKLGELEYQVTGTVRTFKDSVNAVRDSFDLRLQVRRRPWTLLTGATVLGFVGGVRSSRRRAGHPTGNSSSASTPLARADATEHPDSGTGAGTNEADTAGGSAPAAPGWLANLSDTFQPEIAELKGIVTRALLELVRDMLTKQATRPMERPVGDANDSSNAKLGGQEIKIKPSRIAS